MEAKDDVDLLNNFASKLAGCFFQKSLNLTLLYVT